MVCQIKNASAKFQPAHKQKCQKYTSHANKYTSATTLLRVHYLNTRHGNFQLGRVSLVSLHPTQKALVSTARNFSDLLKIKQKIKRKRQKSFGGGTSTYRKSSQARAYSKQVPLQ